MSKPTHAQRNRKKGSGGKGRSSERAPTNDGFLYLGLILIGMFAAGLAFLIERAYAGPTIVLYVAIMAFMINRSALDAYRGKTLAGWHQTLARIPLRCAGFGTKGGKPVEAARGVPAARSVIVASVIVSVLIIAALSYYFFVVA